MREQIVTESFDSQLEALSHVERRRLLVALLKATRNDGTPIDATEIESDADVSELSIRMAHVHLPKLTGDGYVDAATNGSSRSLDRVTVGPRFDRIRPLLELLDANSGQLPDDWR
ncbi:hypothetical protein [Halobellus captivus]|uniref:hypothetical protein n=1 Tax=Halobellus captivus TaxID=2592614 RepID=UPI0011A57F1D|nr:hypothetical protein [Halobellus captivus]